MAIRSRDEIMAMIRGRIGEDTSDEALSLLEDMQDTITDYETRLSDSTDWKAKYEENDTAWRNKYRERFFGPTDGAGPENTTTTAGAVVDDNKQDLIDESTDKSFEELFEEAENGY